MSEVIQSNIERIDSMEAIEQKRLLRVFKRVRRNLLDRLLTIPPGTFTEQQLNVTLVQIQAAIQAITQDLKTGMIDSAQILGERGIIDLTREIEKFSGKFEKSIQKINLDTALIVSNTNNFLINKYQASLDAYGEDLRSQITTNIMQSMIGRETTQRTVNEVVSDVGRFFIGEEWKINRIVRTELHNVYNFSKMNAMDEVKETVLPDLKKALMHPIDIRTGQDSKKLAKENPVVDIDQPFRFKFKGTERVFMFPPDRPNDRAILVPFREEWGKAASTF